MAQWVRHLVYFFPDRESNMFSKFLTAAVLALPLAVQATEYRIVERPRQECWNEQVPVQSGGGMGPVIGGVAGGIIGNQVGGGNGRLAATAIGAMTGAIVGDRLSSRTVEYQTVQRCKTVMEQQRVPVYREPPPVVYAPQPIVVEQPVYYVTPGVVYYEQGHWDRGRHRGWYDHPYHRHDH